MKTVVIASAFALSTSAASAEVYPNVNVNGSLEYQFEAERLELEMGPSVSFGQGFTVDASFTAVADNELSDLDIDGFDVEMTRQLGGTPYSLFGRVELDEDLEYDELAVGVNFNF